MSMKFAWSGSATIAFFLLSTSSSLIILVERRFAPYLCDSPSSVVPSPSPSPLSALGAPSSSPPTPPSSPSRAFGCEAFRLTECPANASRLSCSLRMRRQLQRHAAADVYVGTYSDELHAAVDDVGMRMLVFDERDTPTGRTLLRALPSSRQIGRAAVDLLEWFGWTSAVVIYDHDDDFVHVLMAISVQTTFVRLEPSDDVDRVKRKLRAVRAVRASEHLRFVVYAGQSMTGRLLEGARELGLAAKPKQWILFDLAHSDLVSQHFSDLYVNVTEVTMSARQDRKPRGGENETTALQRNALRQIQRCLATNSAGENVPATSASVFRLCGGGRSGRIDFDLRLGLRRSQQLQLWATFNGHRHRLGTWHSRVTASRPDAVYASWTFPSPETDTWESSMELFSKKVRIVTILEKPFAMLKRDHVNRTGNDRFEGFVMDMMAAMADMLPIDYEFYVVPDGNFGVRQPNGAWNGMVGEVLSGRAMMSVAPLSISRAREEAIDFTKPFKSRGITVLMKVPATNTRLLQFLRPLSSAVWLLILVALLAVSLLLHLLEKLSRSRRNALVRLDLGESLWFVFGSLAGGSSESTPSTLPGRLLASCWWFFSLIFVSTYTANLAAFLTAKKINSPITSIHDLAEQNKIKFGTIRNSGVMSFFENTSMQPYARMWSRMALVDSTDEAMARVLAGDYAFLWDSTVNAYHASVDCDLLALGPPFDTKGFGIGVPPGAVYRELLTLALLELGDRGVIGRLEQKYWGSTVCLHERGPAAGEETAELLVENVAGIFFVLLAGAALALVWLSVERAFGAAAASAARSRRRGNFRRTTQLPAQSDRNQEFFSRESSL